MAEKSLKLKTKKKKWVSLVGPKLFSERLLGEIPLVETQQALHRVVRVNAMNLLGDMKKQHINLKFLVTDVKEGKARTRMIAYEVSPQYVRRMVRKRRDKISDSFLIKTADELAVRVKPITITQAKISKEVQTKLRLAAREAISSLASSYSYERFVDELMSGKLQRFLKEKLGKITSVRSCDVRALTVAVQDREKVAGTQDHVPVRESSMRRKPVPSQEEAVEEVSEDAAKEVAGEDASEESEAQDGDGDEDSDDEGSEEESVEVAPRPRVAKSEDVPAGKPAKRAGKASASMVEDD
ncbi:MAG: hypothetical protein HC945_02370 [Nitrosarchaeum sp.]|nr:hypothetical protein [Nitrosarchaeum sp.]